MAGKRKRSVRLALVCLAMGSTVVLVPAQAHAAGELDPSFGGDGTVITDLGGIERAESVAIQADGRIVVGVGVGFDTGHFTLARYLPDGSRDTDFGRDGVVTTDFGGASSVRAVAIQSDGRIVAAGSAVTSTGRDFALARYLLDGSLDPTFGDDGLVTTHFGGAELTRNDWAHAVALQDDGRIVAAGTGAGQPRAPDFALARYRPDGSLDPSFGSGGLVTTNMGSDEAVNALALDANGKIVAAGVRRNLSRGEGEFALARYQPDGSLDPGFGADGTVVFGFGASSAAHDVAIQPDGKIVAAGQGRGTEPGDPRVRFAVARLLPDGALDPIFGNGGRVRTSFGAGFGDHALGRAVAIQADGRIVAAGTGPSGFALVRYLSDGSLDPSFGDGGRVITDLGDAELLFDMAVDGDDRVVAVGSSGADLALARYLVAGSDLPPTTTTTCAGRTPTIVGTAGDDTITGTAAADVIVGLGGNDVILAGPGDDVVCGGDGADTVAGGLDNDTLFGGEGNDFLDGGGLGPDPVQATVDHDRLVGGPGDDTLWSADFGRVDAAGSEGDDRLFGGPNADRLQGGPGDDRLEGRAGNDYLDGGGLGPDPVQATFDDDQLLGGPGADTLWSADFGRVDADGGEGADTLHGLAGDDRLTGGDGSDRVLAGGGDDRIDILDLIRGNDSADGEEGTDSCNADPGDMVVSCA